MKKILLSTLLLLLGVQLQAQQLTGKVQQSSPKEWTLELTLSEAQAFTALQLSVLLPEGIRITASQASELLQQTSHQALVGAMNNNRCNVIIYSPASALLAADGLLCTLTLQADAVLSDPAYTLQLRDILLSRPDGQETAIEGEVAVNLPNDLALSITQTKQTLSNAPIFTLTGHRVFAPLRPGIYVQGGRKFIVK